MSAGARSSNTAENFGRGAGGTLRAERLDYVQTNHHQRVNALMSHPPPLPSTPPHRHQALQQQEPPGTIKALSHRPSSTEEAQPLRWVIPLSFSSSSSSQEWKKSYWQPLRRQPLFVFSKIQMLFLIHRVNFSSLIFSRCNLSVQQPWRP